MSLLGALPMEPNMSPLRLASTVVVGLVLTAPAVFAADTSSPANTAYMLNCPSGSKQFGNPQDGLFCRKLNMAADSHGNHGPYASYYPNGQKSTEGQYVDGFRSGSWIFYAEDGHVKERIEFQKGNYHGKRIEYFPGGKTHIVEEYANGRRNGSVKEFSEDGKLVRQSLYRDDQQIAVK